MDLIDVYDEYQKHAKAHGSASDLLPDGMHPRMTRASSGGGKTADIAVEEREVLTELFWSVGRGSIMQLYRTRDSCRHIAFFFCGFDLREHCSQLVEICCFRS